MKITYDCMKFKKGQWRNVVAHHERLGEHLNPDSQLKNRAMWLAPKGRLTVVPIDHAKLEMANSQAGSKVAGKTIRKDAVVMIGVHVQLGHSELWRDADGHPLPVGQRPPLKELAQQAVEAVSAIYTRDNIAGAVLHLDETAPHLEIYVTPFHEGRINCKHFLDGPASLRAHWQTVYQSYKDAGFDVEAPNSGAGLGGAPLDGLAGVAGVIRGVTSPVQNEVLKYQLRKSKARHGNLERLVMGKQKVIVRMQSEIDGLRTDLASAHAENRHLQVQLASYSERMMEMVRERVSDYEATIKSLRQELASLRSSITQQIQRGIDAVMGRKPDDGPSGPELG